MGLSSLQQGIRSGLAWSTWSAVVLRLGSFGISIFLARMFVPEQFGIYAVMLTVLMVVLNLSDMGLGTDLIRSSNHREKAPTVTTLSVLFSGSLTVLLAVGAGDLSHILGADGAAPVLAVMSLVLIVAGLGVVPNATLQRNFMQKQVFIIGIAEFAVSTVLTIVLVLAGWGVMALAVAQVAAQLVTTVMGFKLTGEKLRFGWDRSLVRGIIGFGIPLAGANMLSWILLGVDKVLLSSLAGAAVLGFYYLAFNMANWPMSVLGHVVRSVSLPAFSQLGTSRRDPNFATAFAPVWTISVWIGLMLAMLAAPVIEIVYGVRWSAAAPILAVLAWFGTLRTLLDLATAYLLARGSSVRVLWLQLAWLGILVPLLAVTIQAGGGLGAAVAQLTAAIAMVLLFTVVLRKAGADIRRSWSVFWPPIAAALPTALVVWACSVWFGSPWADLLLGGLVGTVAYGALMWRWFRARLSEAQELGVEEPPSAPHQSVTVHPASIETNTQQNGVK